jgi:hypothetical protein
MRPSQVLRWGFSLLLGVMVQSQAFPQVRRTVFPHLTVGGGWSSDVFVTNQHPQAAAGVKLLVYDDAGTPLAVELDSTPQSSFEFGLAAGETRVFRMKRSAGLKTGYAILEMPSHRPSVRATLFIRWESQGHTATQLGVAQQSPFNHFSFPVEVNQSKGINTGIAIVRLPRSTGTPDAHVAVSLIRPDGSLQDTAVLTMGNGAHLARLLNEPELFPGLQSFAGIVAVSAADSIGVLALRLEGTALGSEAINPGPLPAPFRVAQAPVAEQEPDNSQGQAQSVSLPAAVSAVFDGPGDADFFSFQGRAGDLFTAFTEASPEQSSRADTVLTLFDASGSQLVQNDQNGLFASNDSFVQLVLPANGTYYLKVHDYFQEGGPDYGYRIHLSMADQIVQPPGEPLIQSVNPSAMRQGESGSITITGANLDGMNQVVLLPSTGVSFSNIQSTGTSVSAQVQVAVSAATGTRQLAVSGPLGTSNSLPFQVTAQSVPPPTIHTLQPASGNSGTGFQMSILGTNLGGATQVTFTPGTGIQVQNLQSSASSVSVNVQIQAGAATGTRQVTVTTAGGTPNALDFTVTSPSGQAPAITSISPTRAKVGSFQGISILGSKMTGVTTINVVPSSGIVISNLSVTGDSSVWATLEIQSGAAVGDRQVSVTSPAGTSNSMTLTIVPENPPPYLKSIRPKSGRATRTVDITINGDDLTDIQSIDFSPAGGITVSEIESHSFWVDARIVIASGAVPGMRQVTVTNAYGTSNAVSFEVLPPPVGTAPTISNLSVGQVTYGSGKAYVPLSFDWVDPDGDLVWNSADPDQSMAIILRGPSCSHTHSGSQWSWPGQTSGHIDVTLILESYVRGDIPVTLQIRDAEGNLSNILEFRVEAWTCN